MENETSEVNMPSNEDVSKVISDRQNKLAALREKGQAFPNDFSRKDLAADVVANYDGVESDELKANPIPVQLAGRIIFRRIMGESIIC